MYAHHKMADVSDMNSAAVKAEDAPKPAQQVMDDVASDPEEDGLSDLDGRSHETTGHAHI